MNDNDVDDLDFFKKCIVDYFCFEKSANADIWIKFPTFQGLIGTWYFNSVAKRVEIFFIRNNDWSDMVLDAKFRDVSTGQCTNLLYVTAARYLYVTYVLNLLRGDMTFGPCEIDSATKNLIVPASGVCYPVPYGSGTCTSDFDVGLLGARSGSLTALFNQFFLETLGRDANVAGFGKTSEELFDTNVYAFTLEFAMPNIFVGLGGDFVNEANEMNNDIKYRIQEVVSAILKMKTQNRRYFNDLLSDQGEFKKRKTKHNLEKIFHDWRVQFELFGEVVKAFARSDLYNTEISFRRRQNIAYEMILGLIEGSGSSKYATKALSEVAIALMYAAEAYHTRGAIRHVVGWTQMKRQDVFSTITLNDYWVSMLENWADAIKEYNRQCKEHSLIITACLPMMSKYLWRMLDAMYAARSRLTAELQEGLLEVDNDQNAGLRSIMSHWFVEIKKKGLMVIPIDDRLPNLPVGTTNLDFFLQAFNCKKQEKHLPLSKTCVNKIHQVIRDYNRRLFINLIYSDPV